MPDDQSPSPASPEPTNSSYGRLFGAASPPPMPTPPGNWEPPLPDEVSAMLSGYVVTGVLGRGGMGAVYQGVQTSLERPVAIKLLPPELGYDPEFEARFRREAKSMARLNHPNIVQIYDFGTTGSGHHYIVMEFVDGTDLHRLIRSGGLTPEGALNAVSQICDALEYAHGEGFVHRDIKPANIFINNKGILKVGDFGLAKLVEGADESALSATENLGLTMTGVAMGTPHYIAPEQLAADGTVDRRADIYSLGVMFYEMLTGELPRGAVKPPSQKVKALDVRLDDVVFRAMEVDPAERYQSAMDLRTDVDGIRLTPLPVSESPAAPAEKVSKGGAAKENTPKSRRAASASPSETKRSPVLMVAMVAVPLLVIGGVASMMFRSGESPGQGDPPPKTAEVPTADVPTAEPNLIAHLEGTRWVREKPTPKERYQSLAFSGERISFFLGDGSPGSTHDFELDTTNRVTWKFNDGNAGMGVFDPNFTRFNYPENTLWVRVEPLKLSETLLNKGAGRLSGLYYDQDTGKVIPLPIPDDWKEKPVVKVGSHNYGEGRWWAIAEDGEVLRFDGEKRIIGEMEARIQATAFDWERLEAWVKPDGSLGAASRLQPVPAGNDFIDVKVGNAFALGLRKSGEVAVWFEKDAPDDRFVPGLDDLRDAVAIEASGQKGAVLKKTGELVWWDLKEGMQPTSIPDGKTVTALSGNHDSVLILTSDGSYQHPNAKPITGKGAATAIRAGHALSAFRTKEGTWAFRKGAGADEAPVAVLSEAITEHQAEIDASLDLAFTVDGSKNRGVVLWIDPPDSKANLTSSLTSQTLFEQISGKKYYRATNAAEWFRFGPEPGKMVLHNLQGKDNFYEFKALSENEIEWRFSSGPVTGRFEEGVERFVLPDGTFFSTTPGPAFATETEEIAHHVGGSEWQVESKSGGYSIWFNESATAIRTKAGPEYPLKHSEQSYRRLFRWKDAVEDNEIKFDLTYESGHFFDAAAKEGSVPMKRLGAVPAGGLSITNATPSIRSGRLRAFGFYFDDDKRFPVEQPDGGSDYVACSSESGPWQAVRANGDLVVGHERHRPDPPFTTIPPEGLIGSQNVALNREGRLLTWSDHIRNRVGELERVELFDAQHRFAAAKFKNGDIRIWNILPEESPETYQPTREELGDVVKIVAANCGVTFLRHDGTILFCNQVGVRKTLVDRDRFVEIDNVVNGFVGLNESGEVKDWGDSGRVEARDDLPRITAIRGGGRIVAALREDGTWTSWAADDTQEGAKAVQEKLSTIRGAIDLDVYADKQVARMVWIEPVETTKSPPAEAVTSVTPTATEMPGRAAVPADPITNRITGIDAAYHQRYEAEVTKPHAEAVEKLNGQISAALQREQDAASKAGELDEVLQWRRSIDRLGSGQGVPTVAEIAAEAPPVVRPPKLLGFYATYRDLLGKLEAARDEKVKPLRAARDQALDQYQRELTQAGNIDGALRVKAAREAVPDNTPAPEAKAEPATAPAAAWPSDDDGSLLAANRRRYQIDYSRSGTLKVAGTIGSNGEESPVPQPTADEAKDVCFVAARYENGGGWMAVKKNGEVVTPMTGKFAVPGSVKKPRWLDVGNQAIAVNEDGSVTIWGEGDWRPKQVLRRVVKAESGHENSIALHEDGTVSVWGPMYNRFTPDPDWLQDAVDVAAGSVRAFVLKADGRVVGWNADGDLTKQDFRNSPKLGSEYDTSFGGMKNLVAISGNHRGVIGLDNSGRWVNHEKTITPIEGLLKHVTSGYMLACGVTSEGRIFLENLDQGKRRFPIAADAALAARDVISVAGAGDGTDPKFHGFLAWVEADELSQTEPGGLLLLGYRQIEDGTKEEDFPQMELKPGEKVIAVGARNRHGGGYAVWTDQKRMISKMTGEIEVTDGTSIARADSDFQHGILSRDGTLRLSWKSVPGMADELKGMVDFDINGYSAVALKRDGGVILWGEAAGPDRIFQPDRQWLGDLVAARSGFEPGHWWFLRRDGTVGHSGVKGVILDSAFSEPVHVIAPTRVSACLALTRDGRIIHNADPNFTNPLLLKQIPNDRGPFVDLRCGGDVAAAQRPDGSWIAWGAEREKDLALFRELEASGHVRDLRIKGVGGNTTPNGAGNLVIVGIHP